MLLQKNNAKVQCDVRNCKNVANYYFETKGRVGRCYLCADCYNQLAPSNSEKAPPSPQNTIKRKMEKRFKEGDND